MAGCAAMSDNRSSDIRDSAVHVIQTIRRHIQEVRNLHILTLRMSVVPSSSELNGTRKIATRQERLCSVGIGDKGQRVAREGDILTGCCRPCHGSGG
jgi:hypothetical protein